MAASVISLLWVESVATALTLFDSARDGTSFVAATAELADLTHPSERGRLLGFNDLLSGATGAGLALLGGVALSALGVAALAIGGTALVLGPALWILRDEAPSSARRRRLELRSPDDLSKRRSPMQYAAHLPSLRNLMVPVLALTIGAAGATATYAVLDDTKLPGAHQGHRDRDQPTV